jgi:hypothetical protein
MVIEKFKTTTRPGTLQIKTIKKEPQTQTDHSTV